MPLLFFNPPNPPGLQANRDYMGNFGMLNSRPGVVLPPLHLIQMAGTLPNSEILLFDAAAENMTSEVSRQRIKSLSFDAAIVLTSTPTFDADCEMARWMKVTFDRPVYLYGPHPAHVPDEAFQKSSADGI